MSVASTPPSASAVYAGVACHGLSRSCHRLGIAVWLPRPAGAVEVRLLGAEVRLSTGHAGSGAYGYRRFWTGFGRLPSPRIRTGEVVRVRVIISLRGAHRTDVRSVYLSPGWG